MHHFPLTNTDELQTAISNINPSRYAKTRNYLDGDITYLSPYFTHGILSPANILQEIIHKNGIASCDKLIGEFAWREFFQRVWQSRENDIFSDLKHPQENTDYKNIPATIANPNITCGVDVLDDAVRNLISSGYMHNHARMWTAGVITNIGKTHWKNPSKWMFYHLLDGDLASNNLSWQWIAGSFSNKKYIANQENLNRFSKTSQQDTWLDMSYEELAVRDIPQILTERVTLEDLELTNIYPESTTHPLAYEEDVILYSIWNLDSNWYAESNARRILLIEPSIYDKFPMSPKRWEFIIHWATQIKGLEIYVGEFIELISAKYSGQITYREHPLCNHWQGTEEPRKWIYPETSGYHQSFSKFYRLAKKQSINLALQ